MGRMIGATEFKAHCLRILDEVQRTGESVTITKRGKPVAEVKPAKHNEKRFFFGCMKHPEYRFEDADAPAYDEPWDAERDRLGDED